MDEQFLKTLNTTLKQMNNSSESLENTLENLINAFKAMSDLKNPKISQEINMSQTQNIEITGSLNDSNIFETMVETSGQLIDMLDAIIIKIDTISQENSKLNNVGREKYSVIPLEICRQ